MKPFFVALALVLAGSQTLLHAQFTNAAPPPPSGSERDALLRAGLTPEEEAEYNAAHKKALQDNPALRQEGEHLLQALEQTSDHGTPAEKQVISEKVDSHRQKLRAAMLKEDPKLTPIFKKIDVYVSEAKAKQAPPVTPH
ncbi:MAG: hypothetical protein WDO13_06395 [Verrucomicrobiota bacterium]